MTRCKELIRRYARTAEILPATGSAGKSAPGLGLLTFHDSRPKNHPGHQVVGSKSLPVHVKMASSEMNQDQQASDP
jgi:hypothetical protein